MQGHCIGRLAREDIGEMAEEKPAGGAQDRRYGFLSVDRTIDQADAALADVAMAAVLHLLAEETQKNLPAATRRLAKRDKIVESFILDAFALVWRIALGDLTASKRDIASAIEGERVSRKPVAAGAAYLLIIGLDRSRQVGVKDETNVRLVDPHAESHGGANDDAVFLQEHILISAARRRLQAGVIRQRAPTLVRKLFGENLRASA